MLASHRLLKPPHPVRVVAAATAASLLVTTGVLMVEMHALSRMPGVMGGRSTDFLAPPNNVEALPGTKAPTKAPSSSGDTSSPTTTHPISHHGVSSPSTTSSPRVLSARRPVSQPKPAPAPQSTVPDPTPVPTPTVPVLVDPSPDPDVPPVDGTVCVDTGVIDVTLGTDSCTADTGP
jgi:hypothetical protein